MRRIVAAAVLIVAAGCSDTTGPDVADTRVASVHVSPDTVALAPGAQVRLQAWAQNAAGGSVPNATFTWTSSDSSVATVSADGTVVGHAVGTARVSAINNTFSDFAVVIVDDRRAVSVAIEPTSIDLLPNQGTWLRAIVRDSAGDVIRHRSARWSSSNSSMVSVSSDGYARAVGQDGVATITATVDGVAGTARVGVLPSPCVTTQNIAVGQSISGSLTSLSCNLSSGRFAIRYRLELAQATSVRIDLRSGAFDAYLYLTDLNGNTIEVDDDGAGGNDARIAGRLEAGSYIIWATTYYAGATGSFTLSVTSEPAQPCNQAQAVRIGRSVDAYLSQLDCRLTYGQYADRYRLDLSATTTVLINMSSGAVDAFLMITDLNGNLIIRDDDSGGGSDAQIAVTLPRGSYIIWATSYDDGDRGGYRLTVNYESPSNCRSVRPIELGWSVSGYLDSQSCRMTKGQYAERWHLELNHARTVRMTMASSYVDSYLIVTDLKGRTIAFDDSSGGGYDAFLSLYLNPGTYIIWATTYHSFEAGPYQLWVR